MILPIQISNIKALDQLHYIRLYLRIKEEISQGTSPDMLIFGSHIRENDLLRPNTLCCCNCKNKIKIVLSG
jgi:hypothetical protein